MQLSHEPSYADITYMYYLSFAAPTPLHNITYQIYICSWPAAEARPM